MHSFLTPRRVSVLAALTPCLLILAAALVEPNFSYNRRDNFEYCTPIIAAAHQQWLQGSIPFWNPHQNLGEPFTLAMVAGTLYFPYTLCWLLVRLFGWPASALPLVIVLIHTAWAGLGWDRLLQFFHVRPGVRLLTSASAAVGGYFTCMSAVWIFVAPVCAWLPWSLYAAFRLLDDPWRFRSFLLLVAALSAPLLLGHAQFAAYAWLFTGLFVLTYVVLLTRRPWSLLAPAAAAVVAALAAAPSWLPTSMYLKYTSGSQPVGRADFFFHQVDPVVLRDILLPVYSYYNGFLPNTPSLAGHQGSWVAPAIVGGVIAAWMGRKKAPFDPLRVIFLLSLPCALLFYFLAIGEKGFLLRLAYGLPLVSLFRNPMKFLPFSLTAMILAAGLGLEMCWREPRGARWRKFTGAGLAVLAVALLWQNLAIHHGLLPALKTGCGLLALGAGLVVMPLVLLGGERARRIALAAGFIQIFAVVALCHHQELKRYELPYGAVGAAQLGIDNNYRLMPLGRYEYSPGVPVEEFGLFHSATANGYFSATGHHTRRLLPLWYDHWLPVDELGLLPYGMDRLLTAGNLLRSANVRYYIVARPDHLNLDSVTHKGLRRIRELHDTFVYEDPQALPRVYFATEVHPYSDQEAHDTLINNRRPATAVVIEGWPHPGAVATGEVLHTNWDHHLIRAAVSAPQGGFLVVSTTWYPGWSATVDGRPAALYRTNGTLLGLAVPAGGRDVTLRFTPVGWRPGLALAAVGLLALAVFGAASFRKRESSGAPH